MSRSVTRLAGVAALTLATTTVGVVLSTPASATAVLGSTPQSTAVGAGDTFADGGLVRSPADGFHLFMQEDGNLVEYAATSGQAVWASGTSCATTSSFSVQTDGNVVVYCGNRPTFATGTATGRPGTLSLADDGELLVTSAAAGGQWDNGVSIGDGVLGRLDSPDGSHRVVMQADGNLVLYGRSSRALWSSGTAGWYGSTAVLQDDGNLVVYNPAGRALWSTSTFARDQYDPLFVVQDDGNLVMYQQENHTGPIRVAWTSGTAGQA